MTFISLTLVQVKKKRKKDQRAAQQVWLHQHVIMDGACHYSYNVTSCGSVENCSRAHKASLTLPILIPKNFICKYVGTSLQAKTGWCKHNAQDFVMLALAG